MHFMCPGRSPVVSGAGCIFKSLITLWSNWGWYILSPGSRFTFVGAEAGIRCCTCAIGCSSCTWSTTSCVISTSGEIVRELMALDRSQLITRVDTLRSIAFCSSCCVLCGVPTRHKVSQMHLTSLLGLSLAATPLEEVRRRRGSKKKNLMYALARC